MCAEGKAVAIAQLCRWFLREVSEPGLAGGLLVAP
jgi:hypothetical protein